MYEDEGVINQLSIIKIGSNEHNVSLEIYVVEKYEAAEAQSGIYCQVITMIIHRLQLSRNLQDSSGFLAIVRYWKALLLLYCWSQIRVRP